MNVLLVEDQQPFWEAAQVACPGSMTLCHAPDYVTAQEHLSTVDAAVIDCFFPYEQGSMDTEKGYKALTLLQDTPCLWRQGTHLPPILALVESECSEGTEELKTFITERLLATPQEENWPLIVASLVQGTFQGKLLPRFMQTPLYQGMHREPYYEKRLLSYLKQDEANQPLGIMLAKEVSQQGLPFVLATSLNHHEAVATPIESYCRQQGWKLVCGQDRTTEQKTSPSFWRSVYSTLEQEVTL